MDAGQKQGLFSNYARTACIGVAAIVSAQLVGLLSELREWWTPFVTLGAAFVIVVAIEKTIRRFEDKMRQRIQAADPVAWRVIVNGVGVGEIDDAKVAEYRLTASQSGTNAVAELRFFAAAALDFAASLLRTVPAAIFWIVLAGYLFDPKGLSDVAKALQALSPEALASLIADIVFPAAACIFMVRILFIRPSHGYRNAYQAHVARLIRLHCNIVADGDVILMRDMSTELCYPKSSA